MSEETKTKRTVTGKVISNKMDKTITVMIERKVKHPVYGKYIKRSTKLHAHDAENACNEGDTVTVVACRPLSKSKKWMLENIVERATVV
jgi:small subunit ribosomal protein S17